MEAFLLAAALFISPQSANLIDPPQICFEEPEAFWPPDLIPHPTPPGHEPSGPGEPELA